MLTWQFFAFQHQFKIPHLLFSSGQRSTFSDYVSVKSCQCLPKSAVENKENSRADSKRGSLSKDALLAQCRSGGRWISQLPGGIAIPPWRIQVHFWQGTVQPLRPTGCLQLLLCISWLQFYPLLCPISQPNTLAWDLPQSPLSTHPCTVVCSNLTILYPQNILLYCAFSTS